MKLMRIVIVLACVTGLTACSTLSQNSVHQQYELDREYVSKVEASARNSMAAAKIYWVNPPQKRITPVESPED
ncbi:hypothetical protein [Arsukibacterium sp.]|uniref:hypothetical protein n=1 Tax=Arsukibacterium sp. TaxID=1977258 RepID=UPI002FD89783